MTTSDNQASRDRKRINQILTAVLWLVTVILGLLAIPALVRGIDAQILAYIFLKMQANEMGPMTASTLSRAASFVTFIITGLLWLGGIILGGSGYHFRRVGWRSSYRVFGLTIIVELVLIVVGTFLQST